MTKSVFTVHLSKSAAAELKPFINEIIPNEDRVERIKAKTFDSPLAGGSFASLVIGYVFEFVQNKDVCYSFAAIVIAWIKAKHGKKISIKKDGYTIKAENLTEQDLFKILSERGSKISIDSEEKD